MIGELAASYGQKAEAISDWIKDTRERVERQKQAVSEHKSDI